MRMHKLWRNCIPMRIFHSRSCKHYDAWGTMCSRYLRQEKQNKQLLTISF